MLYKLMSNNLCENEFVQLNFQLNDNARLTKQNLLKRLNYEVGKNTLLNRMALLNNKINKNLLNLSIGSF